MNHILSKMNLYKMKNKMKYKNNYEKRNLTIFILDHPAFLVVPVIFSLHVTFEC